MFWAQIRAFPTWNRVILSSKLLAKCLKQPISKSKQLLHSQNRIFRIHSTFFAYSGYLKIFFFRFPKSLVSVQWKENERKWLGFILDLSSLFNQQTIWRTDKSLLVSLPHGSPSRPPTLLMIGAVCSSLRRWCWLVVASWHELRPHLKAGLLEGWHDLLKVQVVVWWDCNGYREHVCFCKKRKEIYFKNNSEINGNTMYLTSILEITFTSFHLPTPMNSSCIWNNILVQLQ